MAIEWKDNWNHLKGYNFESTVFTSAQMFWFQIVIVELILYKGKVRIFNVENLDENQKEN